MSLFDHTPHPHTPQNPNDTHKAEQASFNQRLAVLVTKGFGSMAALYVLIAWMLIWMTLASLGFWLFKYDQYPFPFLLFCSNLIQLWALPVLSVGQNVLSRRAELQADETHNVALKNAHDIAEIAEHLGVQDAELIEQSHVLKEIKEKL